MSLSSSPRPTLPLARFIDFFFFFSYSFGLFLLQLAQGVLPRGTLAHDVAIRLGLVYSDSSVSDEAAYLRHWLLTFWRLRIIRYEDETAQDEVEEEEGAAAGESSGARLAGGPAKPKLSSRQMAFIGPRQGVLVNSELLVPGFWCGCYRLTDKW